MLEILDCAGEEEFSVLRDQWISSLQVLILAFSITDRSSLEELERYYLPQHVLRNKQGKEQNKDFLILLIGNKCDLEHQRVVNPLEGQSLAAKHGWKYFETSAKMRVNVDEMFRAAAESWIRLTSGDEEAKQKQKKKCSMQYDSQQCENKFLSRLIGTGNPSNIDNKRWFLDYLSELYS